MSLPAPGTPVPPLTLDTTEGPLAVAAPPKPLVLFAYPEDDTEGCTTENLEFSALATDFQNAGLLLCGVSPDPIEAHRRFIARHQLKVRLASDPDHSALEALGLWQLKKMFGVEFMGVKRATLIIRPDGVLADAVGAPRIKGHAAMVLAKAAALFP